MFLLQTQTQKQEKFAFHTLKKGVLLFCFSEELSLKQSYTVKDFTVCGTEQHTQLGQYTMCGKLKKVSMNNRSQKATSIVIITFF